MKKNIITIGLILLLFIFLISSIANGINLKIIKNIETDIDSNSNKHLDGAPTESPWPMYCHDVRHTGNSPFKIADNPCFEKWRCNVNNHALGSAVIDAEGTIYIGSHDFYAVNPNGTKKWRYDTPGYIGSAAVIDKGGIIYVGTANGAINYLYAFFPNGNLKWKYKTGNWVVSCPVISENGTIYFGKDGSDTPPYSGYIIAVNPDGTEKWKYKTDHYVHSSPVIGLDGTIYCGSHDGNLYALYPNNGTLKWKYKTSDWVAKGPSIADDGTIYFGSWDGNLYAVHPDGTLKWKKDGSFCSTPIIGSDGTIYGGTTRLKAINPMDGSTNWSFNPGEGHRIKGNPCISADGIIIFGTEIGEGEGGELIAVNPDGSERWRVMLATGWIWSAPAIAEDGTVYVGSSNPSSAPGSLGYLHAIGELDKNAPSAPNISGPRKVLPFVEYKYTFKSNSPLNRDLEYWIEWGDNKFENWIGPYESGERVKVSHEWPMVAKFTIRARVKDSENLWSDWSYLELNNPRSRDAYNDNIFNLFERFPNAFPILRQILGLI